MLELMQECSKAISSQVPKYRKLFTSELQDVLAARAKVAKQICGDSRLSVWKAVETLEKAIGRNHKREQPEPDLSNAILVMEEAELQKLLLTKSAEHLPVAQTNFNTFYKETPEHSISSPPSSALIKATNAYIKTSTQYQQINQQLNALREWFKNSITSLQFFFFHICSVNNIPAVGKDGQQTVEKQKILSVMTRGLNNLQKTTNHIPKGTPSKSTRIEDTFSNKTTSSR